MTYFWPAPGTTIEDLPCPTCGPGLASALVGANRLHSGRVAVAVRCSSCLKGLVIHPPWSMPETPEDYLGQLMLNVQLT